LEEEPKIFSFTPGNFGGTLSWYASPKSDEHHTDSLTADNAEWVLQRCAEEKERPFFLAVGFFRPHTPYVAPQSYFDLYPADKLAKVEGVKEDQADIPQPALNSYKTPPELTEKQGREVVQAYRASISFMDAQVGRVVDALDRLGLADDTIIVFTSDHGYHMGEHGLYQKMSIFEESARVPLLIVAPGVSTMGSVAKAPVGLVDLYPTLADLCDVNAPANLQGQSLAPILKDVNEKGRGWALTQVTRNVGARGRNGGGKPFFGYSLRTPRWRYTEWDGGKKGRELYDHRSDSKEQTNLADDPAQADTVKRLSKQLQAAVKASFPSSGKTPPWTGAIWAPVIGTP
jgi:iduronate 2-sulfatase